MKKRIGNGTNREEVNGWCKMKTGRELERKKREEGKINTKCESKIECKEVKA
jgi:hypothetical protein